MDDAAAGHANRQLRRVEAAIAHRAGSISDAEVEWRVKEAIEAAFRLVGPPTIDGQVVLSIRATQTAINAGRSTVYRLIQAGLLEVVEVKGVGPRVTAASILRHLGMAPATPTTPPAAPRNVEANADQAPPPRRRGRPRSPRGHYLPAGSQAVA